MTPEISPAYCLESTELNRQQRNLKVQSKTTNQSLKSNRKQNFISNKTLELCYRFSMERSASGMPLNQFSITTSWIVNVRRSQIHHRIGFVLIG